MQALNQNLVAITKLLSDGNFHDGPTIGEQLQLTRAAVWKTMKKLEQYQIPFTSIKGKGYRLDTPLYLIDHDYIQAKLSSRNIHLHVLEKVASTNTYLKHLLPDNKDIHVCLSEIQTDGKGRLQRQWYSPFGLNIHLSLLYPFEQDVSELSGLSLVTSLATCHAVESVTRLQEKSLHVKWPNDVLCEQAKLSGNIVEIQAESNGFSQAIIGIGLNVNMQKVSKRLMAAPWTSLSILTGTQHDRNPVCVALINSLIHYLERFSKKGLTTFAKEWEKRHCLTDHKIVIASGNNKQEGTCLGINQHGHLVVKTSERKTRTYSAGDTTLLK